MKNSFFIIMACLLLSALLISAALTLRGRGEAPETKQAPVMTEVYDDGCYTVDAGKITYVTDSGGHDLPLVRLHIANRTEQPLVISTSLCVKASDGGDALPCSVPPEMDISGSDAYSPIDGRIAPGGYTDGYIVLPEQYGADRPITISISTGYCENISISFTLQR